MWRWRQRGWDLDMGWLSWFCPQEVTSMGTWFHCRRDKGGDQPGRTAAGPCEAPGYQST